MQDLNRDPSEPQIRRLEELLTAAAEFEPARPAPIGLASRAVSPRRGRQAPRRAVLGICAGLALAGAAAAAALIIQVRNAPQNLPSEVAVHRGAQTGVPTALIEEKEKTIPKKPGDSGGYKITDAFDRRKVDLSPKLRRFRTVRPHKAPKPVIAKAEITQEVVHLFETGIIAPVLISTPDAESGATILQTSLIEIPIEQSELVLREGYDSPHIRPITNEENP